MRAKGFVSRPMACADLDVILLDLEMPGMKGLQALAEFGRKRPDVPVIVLSSSEDPRDVRQSLASGALGYVPKSASHDRCCLSAIRLVLNGDLYVPAAHTLSGGAPSSQPNGYARCESLSAGQTTHSSAKSRSCGS